MFYVYLIKSKQDDSLYIGQTEDLNKRLELHNKKMVKSTQGKSPRELIYYGAFKDREMALNRERNLKYFGKAYGQLKHRIGL